MAIDCGGCGRGATHGECAGVCEAQQRRVAEALHGEVQEDLRGELAAYAIKVQLEKLVARAKRAGVLVVADSDAVAIRLIPASAVREGVDLRELGVTARVHNACGGGSSAGDKITSHVG